MNWNDIEIPGTLLAGERFEEGFGGIYENSPWVAKAARGCESAPPRTFGEMADRMRKAVDSAAPEARLALLRAHPELAGKAALAGELTADSLGEQRGAGLDQCSPDERSALRALNARYHDRFGFPFIIAVTGLTRRDILLALERRCEGTADDEFAQALAEVHRIAAIRLAALSAKSGPTS